VPGLGDPLQAGIGGTPKWGRQDEQIRGDQRKCTASCHRFRRSAVILHRYGNPNDKKVIWSIVYRLRLTFDGESKKRSVMEQIALRTVHYEFC
jgi:hypothetical protein